MYTNSLISPQILLTTASHDGFQNPSVLLPKQFLLYGLAVKLTITANNANGYKNFIKDTIDGMHQPLGPVGRVDVLNESDTDEDSQYRNNRDDGDDMRVDGDREDTYVTDDDEIILEQWMCHMSIPK